VASTSVLATAIFAGWLDRLPLLGTVPAAVVEVIACAALLVSWWRPDRRWWSRQLPLAVLGAATLTGLTAGYLRWSGTVVDPYPQSFFLWVDLAITAVTCVPVTLVKPGRWQRVVAWWAVPLTVAGAFLLMNNEYGVWPRLGSLLGHKGEISATRLYRELHLPPGMQSHSKGILAKIDIPAARSHFSHRPASVYLPPAFFTDARSSLPVMLMLAGTPGAPDQWVTSGGAVAVADAYASAHHGIAPVLLFVDANGSLTADTECVDGPQGRAETYLTVDVPTFVEKTLHMPHDPARWGIIGFSEGGTCAVILTLVHPHVFTYFIDIGGDAEPTLGGPKNTLVALFGGSTAARDAHDPMLLLASHRYKGVTAWFVAGTEDAGPRAASHALAVAMKSAGGTVRELPAAGGHTWKFSADTLRGLMPELCRELGPG
jgi:S-formylglutathione hydrolase FrmB